MYTKTLNVEGQTFDVTFPNAGQMIDIWNNQMAMSQGRYEEMAANSQTRLGRHMIDTIDAISMFTVLVPKMAKLLNVEAKSYTGLDMVKFKVVLNVFRKQFYPWYSGILTELLTDEEVEELDEDEIIDHDASDTAD